METTIGVLRPISAAMPSARSGMSLAAISSYTVLTPCRKPAGVVAARTGPRSLPRSRLRVMMLSGVAGPLPSPATAAPAGTPTSPATSSGTRMCVSRMDVFFLEGTITRPR
ncbi:MAG: hypothetical protein AUG44_19830 [Actinobacteria bacterium 13_1_20CM_3_71_11]|nr:MAG: hypothetical protein AUG44_19830 [Actinobacteria bacterium 13_1_20CM_3_71_11]